MKKKICVLTATRAEYGLLRLIIEKLNSVSEFDVKLAVTGTHLSEQFGLTYHEIEEDGFDIDTKIHIIQNSDLPSDISKTMGTALIQFGEYFEHTCPDALLVLGDRYETLAVCCAAMNARIPILHLYGGETTEGALDEAIRHSITKMSYLHFTSTEEARKRVIQLGEEPDRVFCVGSLGIENSQNIKLMTRNELTVNLSIPADRPYAVVTFHPATLGNDKPEDQMLELLKACERHPELFYLFTKANADSGGLRINQMIDEFADKHENVMAFDSLGSLRYLSALNYCEMVIGNSSSGLIEAPTFGVPTINIGDRQKGREQSTSVINSNTNENDISLAIAKAMSENFKAVAKACINPYGDGNTSDKILTVIKDYLQNNKIQLSKSFYNLV